MQTGDPSELLDLLLDLGIKHARSILIEQRKKQIVPLCHIINRDNEHKLVTLLWTTEFDKMVQIAGLRKIAHEAGAKAASFITEAWFAPPVMVDKLRSGDYIRPSLHPERRECVAIAATDGTHTKMAIYWIVRNKINKVTDLTKTDEFFKDGLGIVIDVKFLKDIIPSTTH